MDLTRHADVGAFLALAGPLNAADPERHTVALTVLAQHRSSGEPRSLLLSVSDRGAVVGAAWQSPASRSGSARCRWSPCPSSSTRWPPPARSRSPR